MELHKVDLIFRNIPQNFSLMQNTPNPFNPVTLIQYQVPKKSHIQIMVYDILGREIKTLISEAKDAGRFTVKWDGTTDMGESVGIGV